MCNFPAPKERVHDKYLHGYVVASLLRLDMGLQ